MKPSTERRRANERAEKVQRRKRARISGRQPARDKQFREFVRIHPCAACQRKCRECQSRRYPVGCIGRGECVGVPVDAAHIGSTGKGMGQKCSDEETAPLCRPHHEEQHKIGLEAFQKKYGLNLLAIAAELVKRYREEYPERAA